MANTKYDTFIIRVLRQVQPDFAFITPDYPEDLPSELVWVLVSALMVEKYVTIKEAAEIVHDFCVRRGNEIPRLMNSLDMEAESSLASKAWKVMH